MGVFLFLLLFLAALLVVCVIWALTQKDYMTAIAAGVGVVVCYVILLVCG